MTGLYGTGRELYDKKLTLDDSREENGVRQIRLDEIWYDIPKPGLAVVHTDPETFQPVMVIGPWCVRIEPMMDDQVVNG
jgi:hypothetical protein